MNKLQEPEFEKFENEKDIFSSSFNDSQDAVQNFTQDDKMVEEEIEEKDEQDQKAKSKKGPLKIVDYSTSFEVYDIFDIRRWITRYNTISNNNKK